MLKLRDKSLLLREMDKQQKQKRQPAGCLFYAIKRVVFNEVQLLLLRFLFKQSCVAQHMLARRHAEFFKYVVEFERAFADIKDAGDFVCGFVPDFLSQARRIFVRRQPKARRRRTPIKSIPKRFSLR